MTAQVAASEIAELRERLALLVTKSYFVVRHANPDLSMVDCEKEALNLLHTLIAEVA